MALFRFTLDGNILSDEPEGWQSIISELKRDKQSRGQLLLMDLTLRFIGGTDGYAIIKPKWDCEGFCNETEILIEESCNNDGVFVTIFEGLLKFTEIKEDLTPCVLECKLIDDSFFAKIDNNKNIDAYVNVGRSKNDVAIQPATPYIIFMFDVINGNTTTTARVYPVWSCFEFIIDYMTDGEMGFVSDYFANGDGSFMTITTGEQIRVGHTNATIYPFISFQKLFDEVNKKINIGFSIETDATGQKVMRIEPTDDFYTQSSAVTLNDARGIIKSVNTSELYAKLKIGSSETIAYKVGETDFPTDIAFVGFKEESFTLTGKCNIDTELNLVSDWIIDSNVIQDIVSSNNTGYEEDIIFVMADYDDATPHAIQYDVFNNAPPFFYNGFLRNAEVAVRWFGAVPNSIALYLGNGDHEFMASSISDIAFGTICGNDTPYQDDYNAPNFNPSGDYNNISFKYTAAFTGLYTFQTKSIIFFAEETGAMQQSINVDLYVNGVLNFQHFQTIPQGNSTWIFNFTSIYLLAGDLVSIRHSDDFCFPNQPPYYTYTLKTGSSFACTEAVTGGGIFQFYNPEDFKAYQYEFDYPLTFADFETIKSNPLKQITVNDGSNEIIAWINNMKYDHQKGNAKFVLINSVQKTLCE